MVRSYLILLFVAAIGISLVVVGFESVLRHVTGEPKGPVKYRYHPTALATLKPNLTRKFHEWGEMHYYRTNEIGVRDDSPLCPQPDILLFGDSNMFARFLPFNETLGEQLEHLFHNNICAVNFGVPGYGPDQSLARMLYDIDFFELRPKVIVFHVFADNDYGDLFRNHLYTADAAGDLQRTNRNKVDYKLRWIERLQAQYLLIRRLRDLAINAGYYQMPPDEYLPAEEGKPQHPFESSAEASHYIDQMERITLGEFENYRKGQYTTWLDDTYDYHIALNPGSEAAHLAERILGAILKAGRKKSEELGACFIVLIQSAEIDIQTTGPVSFVDLNRYSSKNARNYQPRNLTDIAERAAISSGVAYINLLDLYKNSTVSAYESFELDKGDNHWNAAGVRIAAEALHELILAHACLGGAQIP
jgi:hypothetical protein